MQLLTPLDARRTTHDDEKAIKKLTMSTLCSVNTLAEKCPAPGGHVLQATETIFECVQDIIRPNLLKKFHDYQTINMASRVLTRKYATPSYIIGTNRLTKFHNDRTINVAARVLISHIRKNAPPPVDHVFKATKTIFELIQDSIGTTLLTTFHENRKIIVASRVKNVPPPGGHVFQPTGIIFELV
ncbi:hypothetical protein DPMN_029285 [Dreissena polymorpha]|uniref:Uncharacterized protein n=1 Tax=Dreissena polymorpha TaxID=45954 RepID=A0A9D4LYA5_DREPO|nr:hypothetical protein DPMN_029285 [Dreissena polymorpha]